MSETEVIELSCGCVVRRYTEQPASWTIERHCKLSATLPEGLRQLHVALRAIQVEPSGRLHVNVDE
jgi:hypothetical protein